MRARKSRRWISKAGLMDERLDLVGEVLVLGRHGQGHPQRQLQRQGLIVPVDGPRFDGSLKAVGGTHGVSPYRSYGGPSCVLFYRSGRESRYPGAESLGKPTFYLVHPASRRAPTRERCGELRILGVLSQQEAKQDPRAGMYQPLVPAMAMRMPRPV